jgi:hypothetical protein
MWPKDYTGSAADVDGLPGDKAKVKHRSTVESSPERSSRPQDWFRNRLATDSDVPKTCSSVAALTRRRGWVSRPPRPRPARHPGVTTPRRHARPVMTGDTAPHMGHGSSLTAAAASRHGPRRALAGTLTLTMLMTH